MPAGMVVYRFGPFEFDSENRRLCRQQERVRLSPAQSAIVAHFISHPGEVVPKAALIEAAWGGLSVSDNSLDKNISLLRKILGDGRADAVYIETLPQQGYRFVAPVERHVGSGAIDPELQPFRAFVHGHAQLHTLNRDAIRIAQQAFEQTLRDAPGYARAHIELAMACGFRFAATAADPQRDVAALKAGIEHARAGCRRAPQAGEAWSALAFVHFLNGDREEAAAAAHKAMLLAPDNWLQALAFGYVSWGEDRLEGARRVLAVRPGFALAHWLRATVFIARGVFPAALEEARLGCAAQDAQTRTSVFPAVGLHLLHALILAAEGRLDEALAELARELSADHGGQVYADECTANTCCAQGALLRRLGRRDEANAALARALSIAPGHVEATAALRGEVPSSARGFEASLGRAIVLAQANRYADAARVYRDAVAAAPPGFDGWQLPVEPLLNTRAHPDAWREALRLVAARA